MSQGRRTATARIDSHSCATVVGEIDFFVELAHDFLRYVFRSHELVMHETTVASVLAGNSSCSISWCSKGRPG